MLNILIYGTYSRIVRAKVKKYSIIKQQLRENDLLIIGFLF
ncbi:MAG: hypothetical protein BAJALOKI3v1_70031 [Promethearchaeota archaeon]|nr:MAG: hypothetical protein BAJALOKI3v1_70031 [Candidatus Lokiarchaeota archaeon]